MIYEGRPQPAMPVVSSVGLPAGDRAAIAKVLTNFEGAAGDSALKVARRHRRFENPSAHAERLAERHR